MTKGARRLAELDVAHAVIDLEKVHAGRCAGRLLDLAKARRIDAVVVAPVDEAVLDGAVGPDGADPEDAVLAAV